MGIFTFDLSFESFLIEMLEILDGTQGQSLGFMSSLTAGGIMVETLTLWPLWRVEPTQEFITPCD